MKASVTTSDRLTPPKKDEIEVPILEHARFESSNGYGNESYTYLANQKVLPGRSIVLVVLLGVRAQSLLKFPNKPVVLLKKRQSI